MPDLAFNFKIYRYILEVLYAADGEARATNLNVEYANKPDIAEARVTQEVIEYANLPTNEVRVTQLIIEVAIKGGIVQATDYLDEAATDDFTW